METKEHEPDLAKVMKVQVIHPQGNAVWFMPVNPDGSIPPNAQAVPRPVDWVGLIPRDAVAEMSKKRRHIVEIR